MKTAIISDIHSNLEALTACRDHALAQGVERFVCLGDCVGYGADPGPTLDMLSGLPGLTAVLGNNDEYVIAPILEELPSANLRKSAEWTRRQLTPAHLAFLDSLNYVRVEGDVTYVHASALNPNEWPYVLKPSQARACLAAAVTDIVFIGHVHIPFVFEMTATHQGTMEYGPLDDSARPLHAGSRYVVCVGSVGQPRDGDRRACYVIHDTDARNIRFERVPYDHDAAARKIRAAGLPDFFAERLEQGR
jgi:diadenosine tetraphosphatase ApaH/serine/threonine PP2A family protein phosphatase